MSGFATQKMIISCSTLLHDQQVSRKLRIVAAVACGARCVGISKFSSCSPSHPDSLRTPHTRWGYSGLAACCDHWVYRLMV